MLRLEVRVEKHRAAQTDDLVVAVEPRTGQFRAWTSDDANRWQAHVARAEEEREVRSASRKRTRKKGGAT